MRCEDGAGRVRGDSTAYDLNVWTDSVSFVKYGALKEKQFFWGGQH